MKVYLISRRRGEGKTRLLIERLVQYADAGYPCVVYIRSTRETAAFIYQFISFTGTTPQKKDIKIVNAPQELSRGAIREGSVLFIDNLFQNFPYELDPRTQDFTLIATIDQEIIDDGKQ